jgi:hypothetical protein
VTIEKGPLLLGHEDPLVAVPTAALNVEPEWTKKASIKPSHEAAAVIETARQCMEASEREDEDERWDGLSSPHVGWLGGTETRQAAVLLAAREWAQVTGGKESEVLEWVGIVDANVYAILLDGADRVQVGGVGLFQHLCAANHSCYPNVAYQPCPSNPSAYHLLLLRSAESGEELTVTYTDLAVGRAARREHLHRTKGFWCQCERCSSPMSESVDRYLEGVLCTPECRGVFVANEVTPETAGTTASTASCERCGRTVPQLVINAVAQGVATLRSKRPAVRLDAMEHALAKLHICHEQWFWFHTQAAREAVAARDAAALIRASLRLKLILREVHVPSLDPELVALDDNLARAGSTLTPGTVLRNVPVAVDVSTSRFIEEDITVTESFEWTTLRSQ